VSLFHVLTINGLLTTMAVSLIYILWSIPVLIVVSVVMAATRHERWDLIRKQAINSGVWTLTFLGAIALFIGAAIWWIG
jgi:hypothetical protein